MTRPRREIVYDVRIDRLARVCTPHVGWLDRDFVSRFPMQDQPSRKTFEPLSWHAGRVRYLVHEMLDGWQMDPVRLSTMLYGPRGTPGPPVILDGNHRVCAARIVEVPVVPACFVGLSSTIDWLTGLLPRRPGELSGRRMYFLGLS